MRALTLPTALFPFPRDCVVGRPWWSAARTPDGVIHYLRTDGKRHDGLAGGTPESALSSLARKDALDPLPAPPPCEGQVWAWSELADDGVGIFYAKRMILSTLMCSINGQIEIAGIVWSETGVKPNVWPPEGADLIDGPFSPWSPVGGVSLGELVS